VQWFREVPTGCETPLLPDGKFHKGSNCWGLPHHSFGLTGEEVAVDMGAIMDEETGEEPVCMYCHSDGDCPHLTAVVDVTFAECVGGALYEHMDGLRETLRQSVLTKLKDGKVGDTKGYSEFASIIQAARDSFDPKDPEYVDLDEHLFLDWIIEVLLAAGAEEPHGRIVEEGGPCQSPALRILYARDPKVVIQRVENELKEALRDL
jgi:hypothetical protein